MGVKRHASEKGRRKGNCIALSPLTSGQWAQEREATGDNGGPYEGLRRAKLPDVRVRRAALQGASYGRLDGELLRELFPAALGGARAAGEEVGAGGPQQRGGVVLPRQHERRRISTSDAEEVR